MDTIRELIIQEFIARAAVIRTTGSPQQYATDIGETVLRARLRVDPDEIPCINIIPQPEESRNANGMCVHSMPIRVEGIMAFGSNEPSVVAERIMGDLVKCFTSPNWDRRRLVAGSSPATYLQPYADSIVYASGGTETYPEEGTITVGAMAMFTVTYWTAVGDPFSQ